MLKNPAHVEEVLMIACFAIYINAKQKLFAKTVPIKQTGLVGLVENVLTIVFCINHIPASNYPKLHTYATAVLNVTNVL